MSNIVPRPDPDRAPAKGYELLKVVGRGGFATVYKARPVDPSGVGHWDGRPVAVKKVLREHLAKKGVDFKRIRDEVQLHDRLDHPNVLPILDAFENREAAYIVTEYCKGGDLAGVVAREGPMSEREVRRVVQQVAEALRYLHDNKVMHRDVKLANILIADDGKYKLADFGLAKMELPATTTTPRGKAIHNSVCGTPASLAPEVAGGKPYSKAVDLWGVGVIMYTLLVGVPPFDGDDVRVTLENIKSRKVSYPSTLSQEALHLLNGLLQVEDSRFTLDMVLSSTFVAGGECADSGLGITASTTTATNSINNTSSQRHSYQRSSPHHHFPEIRRPLSAADVRAGAVPGGRLSRARSFTPTSEAGGPPTMAAAAGIINPRSLHRSGSVDRGRPASAASPHRVEEWARPAAESTALATPPRLSPRLNTARLRPKTTEKRGVYVGGILPGGSVEFRFNITKGGRAIVETVTVSGDGNEIWVQREGDVRKEYSYDSLPRSYYQKYNAMAKLVGLAREKTPKLTVYAEEDGAKCMVMENGPAPNFEVHFACGTVVCYSSAKEEVVCESAAGCAGGGRSRTTLPYPLLRRFEELKKTCLKKLEYLEKGAREIGEQYPVTFGRKPSKDSSTSAARNSATTTTRQPSPIRTLQQSSPRVPQPVGAALIAPRPEETTAVSSFRAPPSVVSSHRSRRSGGSGGSEFHFGDGTRLTVGRDTDGRLRFTYAEPDGRELARGQDEMELMSPEMQQKVMEAMERLKQRGSASARTHDVAPS